MTDTPRALLDIAQLTPQERLDLIGELWDSLTPNDVHLSPAQEQELGRRMANFDVDIRQAVAWDDIEADLDKRSR